MSKTRTVTVIISSGTSKWKEDHSVPEEENPLSYIKKIVDDFNKERGYNYKVERLVRKRRGQVKQKHNWDKKSLVTERGGYDKMICLNCGATGKRYGLGNNGVKADSRYHPVYCNAKSYS